MMKLKKIAIIFGGQSSEYEVSLKSTVSVLETLSTCNFEIIKIGIDLGGKWYLTTSNNKDIEYDVWQTDPSLQEIIPCFNNRGFYNKTTNKYFRPDVLFPILHGGTGEDGTLQGVFELMNIPYVGCGVTPSAICMDKYLLHEFAQSVGVKSAPTLIIRTRNCKDEIDKFIEKNDFPIFVKPNEAGSSKGINKVNEPDKLEDALTEAFKYSKSVIIQKAIIGREIGCAVLGNEKLLVGECDEVSLNSDFFDYTEKYQMISAKVNIPASISVEFSNEMKKQAQLLYRLLGCSGLARIDFFLSDNNEILLNEINTLPGFTEHSRYPKMMEAVGVTYKEIITKLINLAEEKYYG
uniref:D-alanine--D-alanine ligase n=1 Tax=Enterococcus faecalis TaxID=1351 RepID=A9LN35_ENTFL|nr:D-alanine--D-serine ligase VanL [Enterococcus faecalis]ABX54687.1 D-alanine-D-serine ligase [Enterococcus faecalis]